MNYLLDTCLISELVKAVPQPSVLRWLDERDEAALFLSVLTIGELQRGIARLGDTTKGRQLQTWLERELAPRFADRLLSVDAEVAVTWGQLQGVAEKRGRTLPAINGLIAATAIAHNLTVVTRNVQDLKRCGARTVNPWEA